MNFKCYHWKIFELFFNFGKYLEFQKKIEIDIKKID